MEKDIPSCSQHHPHKTLGHLLGVPAPTMLAKSSIPAHSELGPCPQLLHLTSHDTSVLSCCLNASLKFISTLGPWPWV